MRRCSRPPPKRGIPFHRAPHNHANDHWGPTEVPRIPASSLASLEKPRRRRMNSRNKREKSRVRVRHTSNVTFLSFVFSSVSLFLGRFALNEIKINRSRAGPRKLSTVSFAPRFSASAKGSRRERGKFAFLDEHFACPVKPESKASIVIAFSLSLSFSLFPLSPRRSFGNDHTRCARGRERGCSSASVGGQATVLKPKGVCHFCIFPRKPVGFHEGANVWLSAVSPGAACVVVVVVEAVRSHAKYKRSQL